MEINKIYCKLDNEKKIQGCFICFAKTPKYKANNYRFDESKDFENAVVIDSQYLDLIHIGYSMIIDGQFIENKQAFENAQNNF